MTNFEGMHSYFWLTSSRLKQPVQDDVPYTTQALRQDLLRVRNAWEECQASRDCDAIYCYLTELIRFCIFSYPSTHVGCDPHQAAAGARSEEEELRVP